MTEIGGRCVCESEGVNNKTAALSWPLLVINSSTFYDHHVLIDERTHAHTNVKSPQLMPITSPTHKHVFPFLPSPRGGRWPAGGQTRAGAGGEKITPYSVPFSSHLSCWLLSSSLLFTLLSTSFHSICAVAASIHSLLILRSVTSLSSPPTPCSGARGSHRKRCPTNTHPSPLLWAHCQRSEEQGTVQYVRTAQSVALTNAVGWSAVTWWIYKGSFTHHVNAGSHFSHTSYCCTGKQWLKGFTFDKKIISWARPVLLALPSNNRPNKLWVGMWVTPSGQWFPPVWLMGRSKAMLTSYPLLSEQWKRSWVMDINLTSCILWIFSMGIGPGAKGRESTAKVITRNEGGWNKERIAVTAQMVGPVGC